jgi:hypothetical protein
LATLSGHVLEELLDQDPSLGLGGGCSRNVCRLGLSRAMMSEDGRRMELTADEYEMLAGYMMLGETVNLMRRALATEGVLDEDDSLNGRQWAGTAPVQELVYMFCDCSDALSHQRRALAIIGAGAALAVAYAKAYAIEIGRDVRDVLGAGVDE